MTTRELMDTLTKWKQIQQFANSIVDDLGCALDVVMCPYENCDDLIITYLIKSAKTTIEKTKIMLDK